ncbi:MAG TPA: TetR-like C-terminal domain-containing protein, partial [Rugosimonospora sp.]|nr:TetR-like C-terminal domain-containing protein [Rugosimonospora sp.]
RTAVCRAEGGQAEHHAAGILESPAFQLLSRTMDDLVAAGLVRPERRPIGESAAWSAAHGLAMLLLDGPLAGLPAEQREPLVEGVLDTVIAGLCGLPGI